VIALAGGDPDFTPPHIIEAAYRAMLSGATHYPAPMIGIPAALEAIAAKMARENGVTVADPRHQIIITPGGKWGLYLALTAVLNPGDEVLILEPHWVSYPPMVTLAGGTPIPVSLPAADNFRITEEALRAKLTPRTKALLVNNPCNPTGRVLTPEELAAIVAIAHRGRPVCDCRRDLREIGFRRPCPPFHRRRPRHGRAHPHHQRPHQIVCHDGLAAGLASWPCAHHQTGDEA
jgi:aspartate aminotransferase